MYHGNEIEDKKNIVSNNFRSHRIPTQRICSHALLWTTPFQRYAKTAINEVQSAPIWPILFYPEGVHSRCLCNTGICWAEDITVHARWQKSLVYSYVTFSSKVIISVFWFWKGQYQQLPLIHYNIKLISITGSLLNEACNLIKSGKLIRTSNQVGNLVDCEVFPWFYCLSGWGLKEYL